MTQKDGDRIMDNKDIDYYRQIIEEALPYIAQTAGGDAVLFDSKGMRIKAVHPDGTPNPGAQGVLTHLCRQVMEEMRPSIGPSVMAPGTTAVRIPLTAGYGLAFNNKHAAKQRQSLLNNVRQYQYARYHIEDIIGESPVITKAKRIAAEAARSNSTILISGETGTGKELFAQAIHNLSNRADKPFVAINCGALPADLVESTLFGYAEGAFTGAKKNGSPGAFEHSNGGTLFLDEISEMPLQLQVKLLRVLQEREVTRVGDTKALPVDVRIIASTNKSLVALIKAEKFRIDLYYRLNVVEIKIPPLRERREDLLAFADFFISKFSSLMGKNVHDITPVALKALADYSWPGNIRELQNSIEYVFNMIDKSTKSILPDHLPATIYSAAAREAQTPISLYEDYIKQAEYKLIAATMKRCNFNKTQAAKQLGLNRTTLWRILKRHNMLGTD